MWQISNKRGTNWNRREHSIWYLRCKLAKVYDPALSRLELVLSVAQHREHIRGASDKQERIVFSVKLQAELWNGRLTGDKVLRQRRDSCIVHRGKWWEQEAAQSLLCMDSCLPRLRSRRLGGSRAARWTPEFRATSDGRQACMHGIRSRRRAVTDWRWTLCLLLLTPSEHE